MLLPDFPKRDHHFLDGTATQRSLHNTTLGNIVSSSRRPEGSGCSLRDSSWRHWPILYQTARDELDSFSFLG